MAPRSASPGVDRVGDADRKLAAQICASRPVRAECLEFELRPDGAERVGV